MKEVQNIEWTQSRDEYLRWICGFANAEGGKKASLGALAFKGAVTGKF